MFLNSTGANVPEQNLFTPYACDLNNPMELERRTINLQQWVDLLEGDIARERKAKDGIQHLAQVIVFYCFRDDIDSIGVCHVCSGLRSFVIVACVCHVTLTSVSNPIDLKKNFC